MVGWSDDGLDATGPGAGSVLPAGWQLQLGFLRRRRQCRPRRHRLQKVNPASDPSNHDEDPPCAWWGIRCENSSLTYATHLFVLSKFHDKPQDEGSDETVHRERSFRACRFRMREYPQLTKRRHTPRFFPRGN